MFKNEPPQNLRKFLKNEKYKDIQVIVGSPEQQVMQLKQLLEILP